jgi:hypothetical protein
MGDTGFESSINSSKNPSVPTSGGAKGSAIDFDLGIVMQNWLNLSPEQRQSILNIVRAAHPRERWSGFGRADAVGDEAF